MSNEVAVGALTLLTALVAVMLQFRQGRQVSEINDAVNHRHEKHGAEAPKLYDAVMENRVTITRLEGKLEAIATRVGVLEEHDKEG